MYQISSRTRIGWFSDVKVTCTSEAYVQTVDGWQPENRHRFYNTLDNSLWLPVTLSIGVSAG